MKNLSKYLFLFLLMSCSSSPTNWRLSSLDGSTNEFVSKKLFYPPENISDGIGLQFLSYDDKIHGSLLIYQGKVQKKDLMTITLKIDNKTFQETVKVLHGNQKLALPEEITNRMYKALKDEKNISIFFEDYEQTIDHKGFLQLYPKFEGSEVSWTKYFKTELIPLD